MRFRDMVLLALCLALAGCGKKGSKGVDAEVPPDDLTPPDLPAEVEGTVVRAGSVQLPAGAAVRPSELQVLSPFEEATPDADGDFDVRVAESRKPQFVFTLDAETDNPVLVGYADPAGGPLDLSCESTAVSLAFLSPTMMGTPAEYRMEFIKAVKAHPDFPVLVAAIEAGFRADPQRLLDPEANPEIYQQAAELSIGAWEGVAAEEAAGKLAFRDMVPVIADEDSTGNAITFINPMFVYYVARIATADQAFAGQSLALVTVDPVPQALNMTWDLPWRIIQAVRDQSLDPLRESNSRKDYALDDGHFEVYLTKGFKGIDNPLTTANGRATLWNISRGLILAVEVAMEFAPSLGDVADNLDLEGGELLDLVVAIVGTDLTEGPDLRGGFEALLKVVSKQAEAFSKRSNVKISQKYADNLSKFLNAAEKPWQVITIGGKVINEGVPYVVDLIFATQEVQYELVHNGSRITALRRQEPEAPLSGNEVERKETFDLLGGADMEMVWVPGEDGQGGFWLGTYEVTQAQWQAVLGTAPWTRARADMKAHVVEGPSYPAVNISWRDAHDFIGALNDAARDSLYRLPTEEEWAYACRAGTQTAWSFGDAEDELRHFAWYQDNGGVFPIFKRVGGKLPNPWGLHDMHGNVEEWVQERAGMGGWYGSSVEYTKWDAKTNLDVPDPLLEIVGCRLLRTAEPATEPEPPETTVFQLMNGLAEMEFVQIEPGSFDMGSPPGEAGREEDERQHEVTIRDRFWLAAHEVTQEQWEAVMGTRPWQEDGRDRTAVRLNPSHPAVYISWDDLREFIVRLNREENAWWYRLPTEAEWEYACRAGSRTAWSHGAHAGQLDKYAWYEENAWNVGENHGHAVGTKLPNPWGLHDMHGNVWEWVQDRYDPDYAPPASGSDRVIRGGGYASAADDLRSANRSYSGAGAGQSYLGARLVRGEMPGEWPEDVPFEEPAPPLGSQTFPLPGGAEMEFVWIEPGIFEMGGPASEGGHENERPGHEVEISEGFYLGTYEVTQGQWQAVMGGNPSHYEGMDRPVEMVSWNDAHEFIVRLNEAAGDSLYRLPTEAEWEYACRAGSPDPWSHGADEDQLGEYAWYSGNNDPSGTKPVGGKLPNGWGLHDMHGNVWEWARDWFDSAYYGDSPRVDPPGPAAGTDRVVRGGKFSNNAAGVRSAYRGANSPGARINTIGFRLLRLEEPAEAPPAEWQPQEAAILEGHERSVGSVSFSPDGRTLASADGYTVRLWDVVSGTQTAILEEKEKGWVHSVSFSPDGRTLASGGSEIRWDQGGFDGTVRLWDVASRTQTAGFRMPKGGVNSVSFSPDGRTLAWGGSRTAYGDEGVVWWWDVGSDTKRVGRHYGDKYSVSSVSFSPVGRTLAWGGLNGTVGILDMAIGVTHELEHGDKVHSVSFSPDGRTLASGGYDGTVRLWDVASGTQTTVFGPEGSVYSVSFSPDGRTLASGGEGGVWLWDVVGGTQTAVRSWRAFSVSFSPDGRTLASGHRYRILLWDLRQVLRAGPSQP